MYEFRQVVAYFSALLGLVAAGYAAAGLTTDRLHSLVTSTGVPQTVHLTAEAVEPAILPEKDRPPVWIAPTPTYTYAPPSEATRARQVAKEKGGRGVRRTGPQKITGQSREPPGQITIAPSAIPLERPMAETR